MKFEVGKSLSQSKAAEGLVLPFWQGKAKAEPAAKFATLEKQVQASIEAGDFKGKKGEVSILYVDSRKEKRVLLLGLGKKEKASAEEMRRAYGKLGQQAIKLKAGSLNLLLPAVKEMDASSVAHSAAEGLLLVNYAFDAHKKHSIKEEPSFLLKSACFIGASQEALAQVKEAAQVAEGVYIARDLINTNADDANPQYLAKVARSWGRKFPKVKTTVFDRARIEKEKMGLLLAVNRGADNDPAFITMEYKGNPRAKDCTVVIGKGVTYDTGGLNLKPTGYIEEMKCDMGGAAVAFGTLYAAAKLGLKKNLTVVVAATENAIGSKAYKPGDVYDSYLGKTVEISNTDAEGRLTLADALAYTCKKLKPSRIIDLATLTGAMVVALGEESTGMMSNDDALSEGLSASGLSTFERVWRLPLFKEYKDELKSDVADLKNCGSRAASAITAGLFLQEFVGDVPWAHLDIAGTAYLSKPRRYHPKYGTGIGVRLLIDFLNSL